MHLKHKARWKSLLGAVKMYYFSYLQDTSLVRKYFWKEPHEWDESRGKLEQRCWLLPAPQESLLKERCLFCLSTGWPVQCRPRFLVVSAPGQLSPSLPPWSLRSFPCVTDRSGSRRPRPDPGPSISPTRTFVGPLKDAGGLHEPETFVASVSLYVLPLSHRAIRSH